MVYFHEILSIVKVNGFHMVLPRYDFSEDYEKLLPTLEYLEKLYSLDHAVLKSILFDNVSLDFDMYITSISRPSFIYWLTSDKATDVINSGSNFYLYLNLFEIFFIISMAIILSSGLYYSVVKKYLLMNNITINLLIISLILSLLILNNQFIVNYESLFFVNNTNINIFKIILILIVIILFLIILNYLKYYNFITYEFSIFLVFSLFSMFLIISSSDLFSLYLSLELQSFCFYILTSFKVHSGFSTEAGLKYFVLGSFSSSLLLYGISLLYGLTGFTNLNDLNNFLLFNNNDYIIFFALLLILIGILFKFGLVPFHMYFPDVYFGTNNIITLFFLIIQKLVILLVFINLYINLFKFLDILNLLIIICIILSIIIGSLLALSQIKIKKLIIYSAIVNSGFFIIGLIVNNIDGLISSLLFLIIYIITTILLFLVYLVSRVVYTNKNIVNFFDLILLKKSNIILSLCFCIALFSIAGIPPLAGFYGKLFLFFSAMKDFLFILVFISIFFTVIISYYYVNLIKLMFFEKSLRFNFFLPISRIESYIISLSVLFLILFFIKFKLLYIFLSLIYII